MMQQPSPSESENIDLASLSGYESFGAMFKTIRVRHGITQQQFADESKPYFRSRKVPTLTFRICSALELGRLRAPHFEELEALYLTFTDAKGFNLTLSPKERELFILLARKRIEDKQKQKEEISPEMWEELAERLAEFDGSKRSKIYLLPKQEESNGMRFREPKDSRRLKTLHDMLHTDTSHLLERDTWTEHMVSYLAPEQPRKLVVIQGHMGIGKSHALALLTQHLVAQPHLYLIPYRFSIGEGKTPDDQLDTFLATLQADLLGTPVTDTMQQPPLAERIEQVFSALKGHEKVVLLLDDAQEIFPSATQWPPAWEQFFLAFVKEPHSATMFLASRVWPGWPDRRLTYIEQTELPPLSPESGARLWKRAGFNEVPEHLLHQISERCGGNPQVIDMKASSLKRSTSAYDYAWRSKGRHDLLPAALEGNEQTVLIKRMLNEETIFPKMDVSSRKMLSQVVTGHFSHQAAQMLEMLAVSPLGIPFSLLDEEFRDFEIVYDELVRASLVDLGMAAANRAAAVPLVREAQQQTLASDGRMEGVEARVTDFYAYWLTTLQDFRDDSEKAALIAEMVVRYIRQQQLLKAAELFIHFGWLCVMFGHISRIQRVFEEVTHASQWKADPRREIDGVLLRYQLDQRAGKKIDEQEQYQAYRQVRVLVNSQQMKLQPAIEAHLGHHLMLIPMRQGQFTEANSVLEEAFANISSLETFHSEDRAALLYSRSRLLARWGESEEKQGHLEEGIRLREECVNTLAECINLWKACQIGAFPLQLRYIDFRLARALNDYAYRLRLSGRLDEAEKAIHACLELKEAGASLPKSLATSLSEYSQILAGRGSFKEALIQNGKALDILNTLLKGGNNVRADKGMCLIERGDIYLKQGRLDEAEQCFLEGRDLAKERDARKSFFEQAKTRLIWVAEQRQRYGNTYLIDKPLWFDRYLNLVAYDDLDWLLQGGPFTLEEQSEWTQLLTQKQDEKAKKRMSSLLVQSREREFALCREEEREPRLCYPKIPQQEVSERLEKFSALRQEIETAELNLVMRELYLAAIDENICLLKMFQAIATSDLDGWQRYNRELYGQVSFQEMSVALQALFELLARAHGHTQAEPIAEEVLLQLRQWHVFPGDFAHLPFASTHQPTGKRVAESQKQFSASTVQHFFQHVFADDLKAGITVKIEPARGNTYIDTDMGLLALPERLFTTEKIRQLLAEEIETHAQRSLSGKNSHLALLGSGLAGYSPTDEGLAKIYIEQVNATIYGKSTTNSWPGTLATGLMAGITSPPLTFRQVSALLEKIFLVRYLLTNKYESVDVAIEVAHVEAWKRASRTVRGVTDLNIPGVCSHAGRIYLQGYLEVNQYLEQGHDIQQLYVGKIGTQHVPAMQELNILRPTLPHLQLALDPSLQDRIAAFDGI